MVVYHTVKARPTFGGWGAGYAKGGVPDRRDAKRGHLIDSQVV